mgnify:CR=1 FL=1
MECLRRKNKDSFVVEIPFNQSFYDYKGLNLELIFEENNITKTALMIIGDTVAAAHYDRSKLYDPEFTTEFREAVKSKTHPPS